MPERMYSTYQVADLLGATPSEVGEWIRKQWLPVKHYADGPARISETGLIQFLKQRGVDIEAVMAKVVVREAQSERDWEEVHEGQVVPASAVGPPLLEALPAAGPSDAADTAKSAEAPKPADGPSPADAAARVAEAIMKDAAARHASHIHLEFGRNGLALRLRIDGVLHDKLNFSRRLPRALGPWVVERFVELAGADPAQRQRPQAGSFFHSVDGREIDFHISACPTLHGEKLLVRLLERRRALPDLAQLGLDAPDQRSIQRVLAEPAGLILVAGPPRSGTTTTLLAMLETLVSPERNVVAVEDSAALEVEGLVQSCPAGDFTFAEAVQASAAQDADAIMVGGIVEPGVARAAVKAAAGGRLVLGAMRAHSAPASAGALLAMGVGPELLSSVLLAVIAQRLLRKLCDDCKCRADPPKKLLEELALRPRELGSATYAARGCPRCSKTGYSGRTGVFSVLEMDQAISALLRGGADVGTMERAALRHGMKPLRQAALEKVRAGVTSLEEVARILVRKA